MFKCQALRKFVLWKPSFIRADKRADRQRDMTELTVTFRDFRKASKNSSNDHTEFEMAIDLHICTVLFSL